MYFSYKLTWKTHIICLIIAGVIAFLLHGLMVSTVDILLQQDLINYPTPNIILNFYIYVILLMIPIVVVHEGIHAVVHILYGGKIKIGFKGIYAYTQEISGRPLSVPKFVVVLMAPVVTITLIGFLFNSWIGSLIYFLNLLGSSGDIYMAVKLAIYNSKDKIVDRSYGYDIIK